MITVLILVCVLWMVYRLIEPLPPRERYTGQFRSCRTPYEQLTGCEMDELENFWHGDGQ